ncbi:MAG: ring-opening amidohydrolase [Betaproteobacteria bacterium]
MSWDCGVFKFPMAGPDDVSALERLIDDGAFGAEDIVGIIAKTEGNGRVNDFSRPLAHRCFRELIARRTGKSEAEAEARVAFVMSGGCEGIISPHGTAFTRRNAEARPAAGRKRFSVAMAGTRELLPEELGTEVQVRLVADAVRQAMGAAQLPSTDDVHYVQVKCPLLTTERINAAKARGKRVVTEDTTRSLGFSNGASAFGIAVGLGEVPADFDPKAICTDASIYTTRGASSSGIELMNCQVLVMGNSATSVSPLVIGHHRLEDLIDADGVRGALRAVGLSDIPSRAERERIVNVFAKGQVPLDGLVRGWRTTLLTDSDLNTRPARAVLGALVASVVGDPAIYASAGWGYHQGPTGGGVAAVIARA